MMGRVAVEVFLDIGVLNHSPLFLQQGVKIERCTVMGEMVNATDFRKFVGINQALEALFSGTREIAVLLLVLELLLQLRFNLDVKRSAIVIDALVVSVA